jgi:hypothetical protein
VQTQPDQICPNCGIWEPQGDDAFCGWCGRAVGKLILHVEPSPIFQAREVAQTTELVIENPTCGRVQVSRLRVASDWVKIDPAAPFALAPGETLRRQLSIDTLSVDAEFSEAQIEVVNSIDEGARITVQAVGSSVRPRLEPGDILLWRDDPQPAEAEIRISVGAGVLNIGSVHVERGDLIVLEPATPAGLISTGRPLEFHARIDREQLFKDLRRIPTVVSANFLVEYDGPDGCTNESLSLMLHAVHSPELEILLDAQPPEFFRAGAADIEIRFRNRKPGDPVDGRDNAPLLIAGLDLVRPAAAPHADWAEPLRAAVEVAGGATASAHMRLSMEPFPEGLNQIAVRVRTNRSELDTKHLIDFIVKPPKKFKGMLAIDFGTSNTCCYALEPGSLEPRPIPIHDDPSTSPAVLRYGSIQGEHAEVEIGQRVKRDATLDVRSAMATVLRLKQRLGSRREIYVRPTKAERGVMRQPSYAAADYLREVGKAAERTCGSASNFVVTHPAVCSLRQYRNLIWAVKAAFGAQANISFLQEPIAGLIPLIRDRAMASSPQEHYYVAAFDLGGGTTDVTLAEINRHAKGSITTVSLGLISSWGVRWGGEDLTDFLVSQLRKRCAQKAPDSEVLLCENELREDEYERLNRFQLRDWAERWKIAASKDHRFSDPLSLRVRRKRDGQTSSVIFTDLDGSLAGDRTLEAEYEAELGQHLRTLVTRLKKGLEDRGQIVLDLLQLSGKSCAIRQVREFFQEQFAPSGTEVIPLADDELKECVVKGACLWQQMRSSSSLRLETPKSLQITTSRIGLWDAGRQKFDEILSLGSPIDQPGRPFCNYHWVAGQRTIELEENLSEKDEALTPAELQVLGSFEPENPARLDTEELDLTLNVSVGGDYLPYLKVTTEGGDAIPFRLLPDQGR